MAIYQFFTDLKHFAIEGGAVWGGVKLVAAAVKKAIQMDRIKLDLTLPEKLKFSKFEINLTTEKI